MRSLYRNFANNKFNHSLDLTNTTSELNTSVLEVLSLVNNSITNVVFPSSVSSSLTYADRLSNDILYVSLSSFLSIDSFLGFSNMLGLLTKRAAQFQTGGWGVTWKLTQIVIWSCRFAIYSVYWVFHVWEHFPFAALVETHIVKVIYKKESKDRFVMWIKAILQWQVINPSHDYIYF
jgi:hypothetical protein